MTEQKFKSEMRRDESRKQRGRGYKDGLAFGEVSSRIGRPSVGDADSFSEHGRSEDGAAPACKRV